MKTDALAALADIELPAPPDPAAPAMLAVLALALALALAVLAGVIWRRRQGRRAAPIAAAAPVGRSEEALRMLQILNDRWRRREIADREACYRLCALLRIGLDLPGLDAATPPAGIPRPEEWRPWMERLRGRRYAGRGEALPEEAFDVARTWLTGAADEGRARHA